MIISMGFAESVNGQAEEAKLQAWIGQVKDNWKHIPEFQVDLERLRHLAVICDGNRRAARAWGLYPWYGHRVGVEVIKGIMDASRAWGIRHLTFWTWSTENWERDRDQIDYVMGLAYENLTDETVINNLMEHGARFTHFGRKDRLLAPLREAIKTLEQATAGNSQLFINLALDYGGRDEKWRSDETIAKEVEAGRLSSIDIHRDPTLTHKFLDTAGQPGPDFVIRTGMDEGELFRTSGFMPYQSAYSCWDLVPECFPDLTPSLLQASIMKFLDYKPRFGR